MTDDSREPEYVVFTRAQLERWHAAYNEWWDAIPEDRKPLPAPSIGEEVAGLVEERDRLRGALQGLAAALDYACAEDDEAVTDIALVALARGADDGSRVSLAELKNLYLAPTPPDTDSLMIRASIGEGQPEVHAALDRILQRGEKAVPALALPGENSVGAVSSMAQEPPSAAIDAALASPDPGEGEKAVPEDSGAGHAIGSDAPSRPAPEALIEALQFYADRSHYERRNNSFGAGGSFSPAVEADRGSIAREALATAGDA